MKIINETLYIEFSEAVAAGFSDKYLRKARSTGTKCWRFIDDPTDSRRVLIDYSEMRLKYQLQIQTWLRKKVGCKHADSKGCNCGDPYAYMALQPIRDMIRKDDRAEKFFLNYKYDGPTGKGKDSLPTEHIEKYTRQASFLNMLVDAKKNKRAIKKELGIRMDAFFDRVLDVNRLDGYGLPSTYCNLAKRIREYEGKKEPNYITLIDWRFGNSLAKKVNDEVAESLLLELLSHPNQYDDVYIAMAYNQWAIQNEHKTIDRATVGVWRRKLEYLILGSRAGNAVWYDKYGKEIKGYRPTAPMLMTEHDDNHIDLQFINPDMEGSSKYHARYLAIVVTDSFNDYVLGYAYAEKITGDLVKIAWLNAMHHIHELTGGWYLPRELKTDNWNVKSLEPFYESIAKYQRTPVGSKRGRGYLEQFFGSALWKRCLKIGANNYTGNNLTAINRGVNMEEMNRQKTHRPLLEEGRKQIDDFFYRLRNTPQKNGKTKQQEWLEAWCAMPEAEKRPIDDMQFLTKFGIHHLTKNGNLNTITNGGVEPTINGRSYSFSLPPAFYLQNVGKKVQVIYDPYDMTRALITDNERLRLIVNETRLNPRAMADHTEGSRAALNTILDEKQADAELIGRARETREDILRKNGIDAESILQGGCLVKELRQQAEQVYIEERVPNFNQM